MSGFLLCWHRSGGVLPEHAILTAAARLARRGPEGLVRVHVEGAVALHTRFTDAFGAEDDLPLLTDGILLAADLRLDDRPRLRAALRDAGAEPGRDATDATLLAAAVRCWGSAATARIIGDFSFAALDLLRRELVAARGTFGVKSLFVAETPSFVALSNDLDALLALPGVSADPDEGALTDFLRSGTIVDAERTARTGVRRVAPSCQRVWGSEGPSRASRHWEFPVPTPLRFRREEEYLERFSELLDSAVSDRLRVPSAGILLSGGLDSPSIAVSARRASSGVDLRAYTVSSELLVPSDELAWAERVARHLGLQQEVSYLEHTDLLALLAEKSIRTPEPSFDSELLRWRRLAARISMHGAVVIDGEDGDALLSPPDLLTMLRTLPWGETRRAWHAYRQAHGARPWLGIRQLPWLRRRRAAGYWKPPRWIRRDLLRRHGIGPPVEPRAHPTRPLAAFGHVQPVWETLFALNDTASTGAPLTVVLPLLDARLFEFVFAIPPIPWCQRKQLIRSAMAGHLPSDVLSRPKTAVHGSHAASVVHWRSSGGAEWPLAYPMEDLIDVPAWRRLLRTSSSDEDTMAAWRVFEVARWRAQPEPIVV